MSVRVLQNGSRRLGGVGCPLGFCKMEVGGGVGCPLEFCKMEVGGCDCGYGCRFCSEA